MITMEMNARQRLNHRRETLMKLFQETTEEQQTLRDNPQRDLLDRGNRAEEETLLARLSEHEREELRSIDGALARLASGAYGRCEQCGGAIGRQRLQAIPEATRCVACSRGSEHPAR